MKMAPLYLFSLLLIDGFYRLLTETLKIDTESLSILKVRVLPTSNVVHKTSTCASHFDILNHAWIAILYINSLMKFKNEI